MVKQCNEGLHVSMKKKKFESKKQFVFRKGGSVKIDGKEINSEVCQVREILIIIIIMIHHHKMKTTAMLLIILNLFPESEVNVFYHATKRLI